LAESAQDLERTRKAINVQLAEFDGVKKSLMRDLQNRCEKVVELEIQLDEIKEQYNNVIRNSNSKAQQKKMAFLERNLEQLTLVQKQVKPCYLSLHVSHTYCPSLSIRTLLSRRKLE
jgi:kinesin family member 5